MAYGTGVGIPGWRPPKPKGNDPYKASIIQGGQDYDDIMARYRAIVDRGPDPNQNGLNKYYSNLINGPKHSPTPLTHDPKYTPTALKYQRGPEMTAAFGNLSEYSRTGGLSDAEGADIRARGISPIRSVYASAQQNLDRNRTLSGGYSPNYAAASTKMSRNLADSVGDATTNVEAMLAEKRQQGRLAMAPEYAKLAQRETEMMGDVNSQNEFNRYSASRSNEDNRFRIDQTNEDNRIRAAEMSRQTQGAGAAGLMGLYGMREDRELKALAGMSGMYGSAPGMAQLYGSQAMQRRGLDQQDQQIANQSSSNLMNAYNNRKPAYPRYNSSFRLG